MSELKKLKDQVEFCLRAFPETRNSDIELTTRIWTEFHRGKLLHLKGYGDNDGLYVNLRTLFDMPREDNVKRIRAKIQNEEKRFVPTDENIAIKRGFKVEEWRELLGYSAAPIPAPSLSEYPLEYEEMIDFDAEPPGDKDSIINRVDSGEQERLF